MTVMPGIQDDLADKIFSRWGDTARPVMSEKEIALALGISVGLGTIFDENPEAERQWMNLYRKELGVTPYSAVLSGQFKKVLELVNQERGI